MTGVLNFSQTARFQTVESPIQFLSSLGQSEFTIKSIPFSSRIEEKSSTVVLDMAQVTQYADAMSELQQRKSQLQSRSKELEDECSGLQNEVAINRERVAVLELEKQIASLEGKAASLRGEKTSLEDRISKMQAQRKGQ
jgi:chromosome segregation ATPase